MSIASLYSCQATVLLADPMAQILPFWYTIRQQLQISLPHVRNDLLPRQHPSPRIITASFTFPQEKQRIGIIMMNDGCRKVTDCMGLVSKESLSVFRMERASLGVKFGERHNVADKFD